MTGCASTITYGEVRRRELFHAMLVAWVLGLALMWRWWSRPRKGNPPGCPGDTESRPRMSHLQGGCTHPTISRRSMRVG